MQQYPHLGRALHISQSRPDIPVLITLKNSTFKMENILQSKNSGLANSGLHLPVLSS